MTVVVALLAVVVALLAVVVLGLLRTNAEVLRALERLGAGIDSTGTGSSATGSGTRRRDVPPGGQARTGRPAVDLVGVTPDGGAQAMRLTGGDRPTTLLLFLSTGCTTCQAFWAALAGEQPMAVPPGVRSVVVARGEDQESPTELRRRAESVTSAVIMSSQAWEDYEVPGSPYVVLVDGASGRVAGEGTGADWPQVAGFLAQATGDLRWVDEDTPRARKSARDLVDEHDTDAALLQAGITPGDPSLYPGRQADARPEGTGTDRG